VHQWCTSWITANSDIIRTVADSTDTAQTSEPSQGRGALEWAMIFALDCNDLFARPSRISLAGITTVAIGRGEQRGVQRERSQLRVELRDHLVSQVHARLSSTADGWSIEDAGSKNGTRVNGQRVEEPTPLADGDIIECGASFIVVRRTTAPLVELSERLGPTSNLHTMSPHYERELALLPKIARSRVAVLLSGDSGTGKEVVAQAIHQMSQRSGAFIAVNCGAIPESLITSELFGSRRGAFSGAEDRSGLVRSAEGGTLFLDEIAELPTSSQASLLRVLQEGELVQLGADKAISVDVRVIAATNRPLLKEVEEGRFRRDLYARLRGYELQLPPLRARIEDLGLLCGELMTRIAPRTRKTLTRSAARALFLHLWPHNIRELEQTLRAAVAVCDGDEIDVEHLRLAAASAEVESGEHSQLIELLERHAGNLSAVARELATSRSQVARLLVKHGVDIAEFRRR